MKCLQLTRSGKKCKNGLNCPHHQKGRSKQTGGSSIPAFLVTPLKGLTLASKEIPVGGQALALIDVILTNAEFILSFMELLNSTEILKQFLKINFQRGPEGVKVEFEKIWATVPPTQYAFYCNAVPKIYDPLENAICKWVETIPAVGPPASVLIQSSAGFKLLNSIYIGLPPDARLLFENPDNLNVIVDKLTVIIHSTLNLNLNTPAPAQKQSAGAFGFVSDLAHRALTTTTSIASNVVSKEMGKNMELFQTVGKAASKPVMVGLKTVGLDSLISQKIMEYLDKVLRPATKGAIKSLKVIFPLFFTLLCLADKCRNLQSSE